MNAEPTTGGAHAPSIGPNDPPAPFFLFLVAVTFTYLALVELIKRRLFAKFMG